MIHEQFIKRSGGSFAVLRWAPLVAAAALPFTFAGGPISSELFLGSVLIGVVWQVSLFFAWRTRNRLFVAIGFIVLVFGSHLLGIYRSDVALAKFIQWLCLVIIFAGAPPLLFRVRSLRFARLNRSDSAGSVKASQTIEGCHAVPMPAPSRERSLLVFLALVFCLPPLAHYRLIEPRLDSLRVPATAYLLPADFLFLRYFGQMSVYFPIFFAGLLCWSFSRPASARLPLSVAIVAIVTSSFFFVAYVCYTLLLIGSTFGPTHF